MVVTLFNGRGVGFGFGVGCGFGIGWGFGGSSLHTLGLGIGGGCGVGVGLGWGFGAAYGTQYFDSKLKFEGVEFGKSKEAGSVGIVGEEEISSTDSYKYRLDSK